MIYDDVKISMSREEQCALYDLCPHWHGCALGPPPYGQVDPVRISVDLVFQSTREDAEAVLREHIRDACEMWGRIYDEDEWVVEHVFLRNGN